MVSQVFGSKVVTMRANIGPIATRTSLTRLMVYPDLGYTLETMVAKVVKIGNKALSKYSS